MSKATLQAAKKPASVHVPASRPQSSPPFYKGNPEVGQRFLDFVYQILMTVTKCNALI